MASDTRAEALRLAKVIDQDLPGYVTITYGHDSMRQLATALLAAEAEIERLRRGPVSQPCPECHVGSDEPCIYVENKPRMWWRPRVKQIQVHSARLTDEQLNEYGVK